MRLAAVVIVLGVAGLLMSSRMVDYLNGPVEHIVVTQCGTQADIFVEVSPDAPGTWWVTRGPLSRDDKVYVPSVGDFVLFTLSAGVVLGGLASLGTGAIVRWRGRRGLVGQRSQTGDSGPLS